MIGSKTTHSRRLQRIMAVIGLLCLLLSLGAIPVHAAGTARVTVSSCTVERGTVAAVTLSLEGNPGIWGLKLKIGYDKSQLTLQSAAAGSVFASREFVMSKKQDTEPYVIVATSDDPTNKTADGELVTLTFTVAENAEWMDCPVSVEVDQAINSNGKEFSIQAENGAITVVPCVHTEKEWRITMAAQCETAGKESKTCKKCGEIFETRAIEATGHQHTEVRNAVAATETAEGYTGDTYCRDCHKRIAKGQTIPKSADDTPQIIRGTDAVFRKGSQEPLVFVSRGDFSQLTRVEIDGTVLDENDYTVEGDTMSVTIQADCLNRLDSGRHLLSIVFENGTATTPFTIEDPADTSDPNTEANQPEPQTKPFPVWLAVVAGIVIVLAGGAAALILIRKRRS